MAGGWLAGWPVSHSRATAIMSPKMCPYRPQRWPPVARDGERPEFHDSVNRAKLLIENQYERKLDRDKPAGAIFVLKNMGWSDRQELELKGSLAHLDLSQLPDEALSRMAAGEHPLSVLATAE